MAIDLHLQRMLGTALVTAALFCSCLLPLSASPPVDPALSRLRQEIQDVESRIRGLETQREGFLLELQRLDLQVERQRRHLARLEREQELNQTELERIRDEAGQLEERLIRDRTELAQRMASLYRMGRMNYLRLFLSADSAVVMAERLRYLSYLASRDARLIESCVTTLEQLEQRRADLSEQEERLAKLAGEEQRRQASSLRLRRERKRMVDQVGNRIDVHQRIAADLETSARNLEKLFESLNGATATVKERAQLLPGLDHYRSFLPWPAPGKLAGRFGRKRHPRFGTTTISNGILIDLPAGSPAKAVYFGMVVYDDWLHGYGNLVIVSHGGESYSLYAHLQSSAVSMGDWLNKGDLLGYSGASGSLSGPALYFELRIDGEPVDPLRWLERR